MCKMVKKEKEKKKPGHFILKRMIALVRSLPDIFYSRLLVLCSVNLLCQTYDE